MRRRARWQAVVVLANRYMRAWNGSPEEWGYILRDANSLARGWYGAKAARDLMDTAWGAPPEYLCVDHGQVIAELMLEAVEPNSNGSWLCHITAGAAVLRGMTLASTVEEENRRRAMQRAADRSTVTPPRIAPP